MYYVFTAQTAGQNDSTFAEVIGEMPNFLSIEKKWSWWSDVPLPVSFPRATFSIDESIYQDAYRTGSIFDLHSEKLADLIRVSGTRCEYFPVEMVSRESGKNLAFQYFAFHLMDIHDAIDYTQSTLIEDWEPVPEFIVKVRMKKGNAIYGKRIVKLESSDLTV